MISTVKALAKPKVVILSRGRTPERRIPIEPILYMQLTGSPANSNPGYNAAYDV